MTKRTTRDLIDTLRSEAEAEDVIRTGLVVGFDERTAMVWSSDEEPLEALNGMVREGGLPVGMTWFRASGLEVDTLPEFEGVEWAKKYLASVMGEIARGLAHHLGVEDEDLAGTRAEALIRAMEKGQRPG